MNIYIFGLYVVCRYYHRTKDVLMYIRRMDVDLPNTDSADLEADTEVKLPMFILYNTRDVY